MSAKDIIKKTVLESFGAEALSQYDVLMPLTYEGKQLVRCGKDIYYGSMSDPYVVYLQVLTTRKENNVDVADKVHIVLLSTDESKPLPERVVRQANKSGGLFNALEFGNIMLRSKLKGEKK